MDSQPVVDPDAEVGGGGAEAGRIIYDAQGRAYWVTASNPYGTPLPRFDKQPAPPQAIGATGIFEGPNGELLQQRQPGPWADAFLYGDAPSQYVPADPAALGRGGLDIYGRPLPRESAGRAPTQPDSYIDADGTLHAFDPFTGAELYTVPGAGKPQQPQWQQFRDERTGQLMLFDPASGAVKVAGAFDYPSLSPEQQRAQQMQDAQTQRGWQQEDYARQQADSTAARRESQEYQAQQASMDRAQRASEFAARHGLDTQRARLDAATTVAARISDVSPAALPAFMAAGGGNISNALAGGATALTPDAMLGAARGLRSIDELNAPTPVQAQASQPRPPVDARAMFTANSPYRNAGRAIGTAQTITGNGELYDWVPGVDRPVRITGGLNSMGQRDPNAAGAWDRASGGQPLPAFAYGTDGWIKAPSKFVVNDAGPDGDEELLEVRDPEGNARLRVHPAGAGRAMPHFAFGTIADPTGSGLVTPEDKPYIDRIRAIREAVDVKPPIAGGYFNVRFGRQAPSIQNRYFSALQDRYAVPEQDTRAEANRYTPRFASRGSFGFGY